MEAAQGVCSAGGASPAGLVIGIILTFCLVAGFAFLFALLADHIRDRKKQLTFVGGLVTLLFAVNIVADIFPGLFEVLPVPLHALALLFLVPLTIVLAGLLWSWPENHAGIPTDGVLCSLIVTAAGLVLLALLSISGFMARLVHPATTSPGQAVISGGCTMLIAALIVFAVTLVLAAGGYRLLVLIRNR
jgi:asparagine N-glycosylation enzyme membrane subunit Stt3